MGGLPLSPLKKARMRFVSEQMSQHGALGLRESLEGGFVSAVLSGRGGAQAEPQIGSHPVASFYHRDPSIFRLFG